MLAWIFIVIAIGLFGVALMMWTDFAKKQRQLLASQESARLRTAEHQKLLDSYRIEIAQLEDEIVIARNELGEIEQNIIQKRERLEELEEQEERRAPSRHRIERDGEGTS